jgi:hypothetical protein
MMKNQIQLALLVAASIVVGGALVQLFHEAPAQAQQTPRQWHECFSATLWHHDGAAMANPRFAPRVVHVPPGWVPVGGTSSGGATTSVVLCR